MLFRPGDRVRELHIIRYVGSGAFGEVYQSNDIALNRPCAAKFVENKDPTAFKAHLEAQILHQCKHDRVVEVFDVQAISHKGKHYAVIEMEFLPLGSVEDAIGRGHITARQALRWIIDILFGLENAHANGVLHRDIKPANFMIGTGKAKLSDFGLAKSTGGVPHGSAAGTPIYAAPELFSIAQTSVLSDVYSVGVSLFQLLSNLSDWQATGVSTDTIVRGRLIKRMGFPDYVPERLRRICRKACNADPQKRYQSARELRQALEDVQIEKDWIELKTNHWQATVGTQLHEITISPKRSGYEIVYLVNARRKNQLCKSFGTMEGAVADMQRTVAITTLR